MHAQVMYFDGPRSDELVAAAERAGKQRLTPTLLGDERARAEHVATYVLRGRDGGEIVIAIMDTEAGLDHVGELLSTTALLPGEDEALLPGPDRTARYTVIHAIEHGRVVEEVSS